MSLWKEGGTDADFHGEGREPGQLIGGTRQRGF